VPSFDPTVNQPAALEERQPPPNRSLRHLFPRSSRPWASGVSPASGSASLPDSYEAEALPIVNELLERAGVRLATVLNACLQ
jgi:hypothetical protein